MKENKRKAETAESLEAVHTHTGILNNKKKGKLIVGSISACAIVCALTVAVIRTGKNENVNLNVASNQTEEPKAITTPIRAGTPNENNATFVDSKELDENLNPKKVPVPRGYVASPLDEEKYVNGETPEGEERISRRICNLRKISE